MAELDSENSASASTENDRSRKIVDRLVFAALTEQRRARRWRVFFMLFFFIYISVVTIMLFTGADDGSGPYQKADGEKHTALVRLSGVIASGEEADAENIISGLKSAFKHEDTAGVVLEINSPGGSPVQSAYIYDEIRRLREQYENIPLYVVVGDIAASGGYFVAAAADRIYVNKSSLVGSIGVRLDAFGVVELMQKLGVERRLLIAGDNKALLDPFLPEQAAQKAHLQQVLNQVHAHFIDAVKRGRGDRLVESEDIFSGLVWSGEGALTLGLADAYGTRYSVARELSAEDIVDFTPRQNLLMRLADRIGASAGHQFSDILFGGLNVR